MKRLFILILAILTMPLPVCAQQFPSGAQNSRGQMVDVVPMANICAGGVFCPANSSSNPSWVQAGAGSFVDGALATEGFTTDAPCVSDTATCTQIALLKRENQRLTSLISAIGSPFQAGASIGNTVFGATQSGSWSVTASDAYNAPFQGVVAMTVGTTYGAQRSIGINCTASGNVSLTLSDASTVVLPVTGYAAGAWQTFPFAVTAVNTSGTTATCTYYNLK